MFLRVIFTFVVFGIIGTLFNIIYVDETKNKSKGAVLADIARGVGYKTEEATDNFWSDVFKMFHNVGEELKKPANNRYRR